MEAKSKKFLFENCFQDDMPQKNNLRPVKSCPRRPRTTQEDPGTPPRRSKTTQGAPKTPPRQPKTPPRRLQDICKTSKTTRNRPKTRQDALKTPQDAPGRCQNASYRSIGLILAFFLVQIWSILEHLGVRPGFGSLRFGRAGFRVALARRAPALRAQHNLRINRHLLGVMTF